MSSYYHQSWKDVLESEFKKPYFENLSNFLKSEYKNQPVYPEKEKVFNAFQYTPLEKVKVIILGQDPYHGAGQAEGLSFSVPKNMLPPPSLKNIFKELKNDRDLSIPFHTPGHGNLLNWALQGVLLLNAVLTVRANQPASHQNAGWEIFTDNILTYLSEHHDFLVFMLWGNFAKSKAGLLDQNKHLILTAAHPSPFSASSGFFGCKHFSIANHYLRINKMQEIDWNL